MSTITSNLFVESSGVNHSHNVFRLVFLKHWVSNASTSSIFSKWFKPRVQIFFDFHLQIPQPDLGLRRFLFGSLSLFVNGAASYAIIRASQPPVTKTPPQKHHHINTTTKHHHTTSRTPQKHHHKNTSTRTPPQAHHHKNTTTQTPCWM